MDRVGSVVGRGLLAGTLATVAMSGVIAAARAAGLFRTPPPEQITASVTGELGGRGRRSSPAFQAGWISAHLLYGAACGAIFALGRRLLPTAPSQPVGAAFGLLVWAGSYLGLLPALSVSPPTRDAPGRVLTMIVAHLVFGASLAESERRLSR